MINVDYELLVGKVLADKNSRKIGLIVNAIRTYSDVHNNPEIKKIVIKIERLLKKELLVEIDANYVVKIEGYYAWLSVTKNEFELLAQKAIKNGEKKLTHKKVDLAPLKNYKSPPSF